MRFESSKNRLLKHKEVWKNKKALRLIYEDYFQDIAKYCVCGPILEVGGGFGSFKEYFSSVTSTDIVLMPNIDVVCDAHFLPFHTESFANVIGVDVLHHLESPLLFFKQVSEILETGGRLVLVEPAITPLGGLIYAFHSEAIDMSVDPLEQDLILSSKKEPFEGNQAIATLMSGEYREELERKIPNLELKVKRWKGVFCYPLSGGFSRWSLMPHWMVPALLKFEDSYLSNLGSILSTRIILVYQKTEI